MFTALNAIPIYTIAIKYVAWIYVVPSVEMGQFFFALRFFGQRQKILRSHRLIFQRWLGSMIVVGSLGLGNLGWTKVTYVVYPHR